MRIFNHTNAGIVMTDGDNKIEAQVTAIAWFNNLLYALSIVAGNSTVKAFHAQLHKGEGVTFYPYDAQGSLSLKGRKLWLPEIKDDSAAYSEFARLRNTNGKYHMVMQSSLMFQAYGSIDHTCIAIPINEDKDTAIGSRIQQQSPVALPHEWIPEVVKLARKKFMVVDIEGIGCELVGVSTDDEKWASLISEVAQNHKTFPESI